jgi:hypothetical protein
MLLPFGLALWIMYYILAVHCAVTTDVDLTVPNEVLKMNKRLRSVGPSHDGINVVHVGSTDQRYSLYSSFSFCQQFYTGDPGRFSQLSFPSGFTMESSGVEASTTDSAHRDLQRLSEGGSFDSSLMFTNVVAYSSADFFSFSDSLYSASNQYSVFSE